MNVETFRKLVKLDPEDALSRFGLGQKLLEVGELQEAAEHLRFANRKSPFNTCHRTGALSEGDDRGGTHQLPR